MNAQNRSEDLANVSSDSSRYDVQLMDPILQPMSQIPDGMDDVFL